MQEWKNLIYGCLGLKIAIVRRRSLTSCITRSKNSFKMLSYMISILSLKSSTFIKNFQPLFKIRFPNLFLKLSRLISIHSFWIRIQVSSINLSFPCIAESTSQGRLSYLMVKNWQKCISFQKVQLFFTIKKVWHHLSSFHNTPFSANIN